METAVVVFVIICGAGYQYIRLYRERDEWKHRALSAEATLMHNEAVSKATQERQRNRTSRVDEVVNNAEDTDFSNFYAGGVPGSNPESKSS